MYVWSIFGGQLNVSFFNHDQEPRFHPYLRRFSSSPASSVGNISTPYMQRSFSEGHCPPYTYHSLRSPVSCSNCVAQHLVVKEHLHTSMCSRQITIYCLLTRANMSEHHIDELNDKNNMYVCSLTQFSFTDFTPITITNFVPYM